MEKGGRELEYLDEFLESNNKLVKNTLDAYATDLKQFFKYNRKDLEKFDGEDIERYIRYLLAKGYKTKTINRKLTSIKKYLIFLNQTGRLQNNISSYIEGIRIQEEQYLDEDKIINNNEFKRLLNQAKQKDDVRAAAIITLLGYTGLRVSEVIQLKGVGYKTGEVTVRGKGRKFRNIPIADEVIEAIDEYRKVRKHDANDYIFINEINNNPIPRQKINEILSYYGGKARIKKTKTHPHAFRHLAGINLSKVLPIAEVATLLGHSNINTTKIYTRTSKDELKRKSQKVLREAYS